VFNRHTLVLVGGLAVSAVPAAAQRLTSDQQFEVRELVTLADNAIRGEFTPQVGWADVQWHAMRGPSGETYVPFTVALSDDLDPPLTGVALYIRVARRGDRTTSVEYASRRLGPDPGQNLPIFSYDAAGQASANLRAMENASKQRGPYVFQAVHFAPLASQPDPLIVQRAFAVPPGTYDVYFVLRERPMMALDRPRSAVLKRVVEVRGFDHSGLSVTTPILAAQIRTLARAVSPQQQAARPYAMGAVEIVPVATPLLQRGDNPTAVMFVYNATTDAAGKPDILAEYQLHTVDGEGVAHQLGYAQQQRFDNDTLPEDFDYRRGHQLVPSTPIAEAPLPPGAYRFHVTVTDRRTSGKATASVEFRIGK
jgi:hypothetical protein